MTIAKTKVKFCGITRQCDATEAVAQGVDALGYVLYKSSGRYIAPSEIMSIIQTLPPFVTNVLLFVNEDPAVIQHCLDTLPIQLLQFHGDETPEFCDSFQFPYIKAIRIHDSTHLAFEAKRYHRAKALLVDSFQEGVYGGTGDVFNWDWLPEFLDKPLILAGGLTPLNVGSAIAKVHPYALDVSSGIEQSPGIKDPVKMQRFMDNVRKADEKN